MFEGNRHSASSLMCILKKWWRARGKSNRSHRNESYQQTATVPSASGLAVSPCQSTNSSGLLSATSSQPSSGKHKNLGNRKTQPRRADKSMEPNSNLLASNNNNKKLSSSQKLIANKKVRYFADKFGEYTRGGGGRCVACLGRIISKNIKKIKRVHHHQK